MQIWRETINCIENFDNSPWLTFLYRIQRNKMDLLSVGSSGLAESSFES